MRNNRWLILAVMYMAYIAVTTNQYKLAPILESVAGEFNLTPVAAEGLASLFPLLELLLALPAAILVQKTGLRNSGAIALFCLVLGGSAGALAGSGGMLAAAMVLEGGGLCLMGVVAPVVALLAFPKEDMSLPLGILGTADVVGKLLLGFVATPIYQFLHSWRGDWWIPVFLSILAMVIYVIWADKAGHPFCRTATRSVRQEMRSLEQGEIWLLALVFLLVLFIAVGFLSWAPVYFNSFLGLSQIQAGASARLAGYWMAPGSLFAGWLLTITKERYAILAGSVTFFLLTYTTGFLVPDGLLLVYLALFGFLLGFISLAVYASIPVVLDRPYMALGFAVFLSVQGMAQLAGRPLFLYVTAGGNWTSVIFSGAVILFFSVIVTIFLHETYGRQSFKRQEQTM